MSPARRAAGVLGASVLALALTAAPIAADAASPRATSLQPTLPDPVPSTPTPDIKDGVVDAVTEVGSTVIVGGSFTSAANHGSTTTAARTNLLAYDARTGALSAFAPQVDGTVDALAPGPGANTVYVGGFFNTVNGVTMRSVALLNTATGAAVPGFTPPPLNGVAFALASGGGHLLVGGSFTVAAGQTRDGLLSLNPSTGALDSYAAVPFLGHHNYDGTGSQGRVGPKSLSVSPDGTHLLVAGNFTTAAGQARDQLALLDLGSTSATLDTGFATQAFTAACNAKSFDVTISQVQYSPDGSYFAVASGGGSGGKAADTNSDGTSALCDAAARFESAATGSDVQPTWVDKTGEDSLWSVAVTDSAVYVGGHQRWMNNPSGYNRAAAGAVPRPGLTALDPVSGLPLSWDPGRNPRGAGAYALLATADALYVGSDTDYIGNFQYLHQKIASFPVAGGVAPASTTTYSLPGDLYLAGPLSANINDHDSDHLDARAVSGSTVGPLRTVSGPFSWSTALGAFLVGNTIFFATTNGAFYRASYDGSTIGSPVLVDPYHDPYWDGVATGSKNTTYDGVQPTFYAQLASVTGAFYSGGKIYYTLVGKPALHWRWFSPDSGVVGAQDHSITAGYLKDVAGMTLSGSTLYYANRNDGTLHTESFVGGRQVGRTDTVVSGPSVDGNDWRANGLFVRSSG